MNVLSIDIDFFFKDMRTIQKYMDVSVDPLTNWKIIEARHGHADFKPDEMSMEFVKNVILSRCTGVKEIHLIEDHDEIVQILAKLKNNKEYVNVMNFDYHHDITYHTDNYINDKNDMSEYDLSDWVRYCRHNDYIKEYAWIHQDDSQMILNSPISYMHNSWKDLTPENVPQFDVVVICVSPQYTPPKYWKILPDTIKEWITSVQRDIKE